MKYKKQVYTSLMLWTK